MLGLTVNRIIKVSSFPRSGTNYLLMLLKQAFYADRDVSLPPGRTGHFSHRLAVRRPAGRLFRTHMYVSWPPPRLGNQQATRIKGRDSAGHIYLYRDGRDVCTSLYLSKRFLSDRHGALTFERFLRTKLDWETSAGKICLRRRRRRPPATWYRHVLHHVSQWVLPRYYMFVRYEEAVLEPERVLGEIAARFGLARTGEVTSVGLVGPEPHAGPHIGRWREHFSDDDLRYFYDIVPRGSPFLWHGATDSDTGISSAEIS